MLRLLRNLGSKGIFFLIASVLLPGTIRAQVETNAPSRPLNCTTNHASESGKPVLRWLGLWNGKPWKEQFEREMAREFAFLHPEVKVELLYYDNFSDAECARLIADMIETSNYCYDVVWSSSKVSAHVKRLIGDKHWEYRHLVDFLEVDGFRETQLPFIIEHASGPLTGPCIEGQFFVSWYNTKLAKQVGLEVPAGPVLSIETLLAHAKQLHVYNQTAETPVFLIQDYSRATCSARLFKSLLTSLIIDQNGEVPIDLNQTQRNTILLKTLSALEELARYDALNPASETATREQSLDLMLSDRALLYFDSTSTYNEFRESSHAKGLNNMQLFNLPSFSTPKHSLGSYSSSWAVMNNSPNRDIAIELLKFWSRPEVAEKWVRNTKSPSGLNGNLYNPNYSDDTLGQYQEAMTKQNYRYIYAPRKVINSFWPRSLLSGSEFHRKVQAILAGERTAQEIYNEIAQ